MFSRPLLILAITFLASCRSSEEAENDDSDIGSKEQAVYICAVAGHIYGSATDFTGSIHPPFMKKFRDEQSRLAKDLLKINSLILTGDVVAKPTPARWDSVMKQLDSLGIPWYISPGNHDFGGGFKARVQTVDHLSFTVEEHLFLILNTTHAGWKPDTIQLNFIEEELENLSDESNVFVFTHQLWWQRNPPEKMEIDSVRPNSYALYDGNGSFWNSAFPLFENLEQECYYFAGDLGADPKIESYYEDHWENHHFYGSGMGSGLADNFLLIKIYENSPVEIQRIDF